MKTEIKKLEKSLTKIQKERLNNWKESEKKNINKKWYLEDLLTFIKHVKNESESESKLRLNRIKERNSEKFERFYNKETNKMKNQGMFIIKNTDY